MKSLQSKFNLPIAVKQRNKFDLSCDHYTTNDFFRMKPVYIHEVVPTEEININMHTFSRTVALRKPFYGQVEFINRAFFIPFRTIVNNWNEFITESPDGAWVNDFVPYVKNEDLVDLFYLHQDKYAAEVETKVPGVRYDFEVVEGSITKGYILNKQGKAAFDILRNLGYHINFHRYGEYDTEDKYSALPVLAFWRVYWDWFKNPNYINFTPTLKRDLGTHLTHQNLNEMFQLITYSLYEKDYFTTSSLRPTGLNSANSNIKTAFTDISNDATGSAHSSSKVQVNNTSDPNFPSTPHLEGVNSLSSSSPTPYVITQYTLDRLKQATDYVKRLQLVGNRALDRFKALFGIELPAAKLERSEFLGTNKMAMQVGEVMIQADTSEGVAGDYTGRSAGYGSGSFHFKSDEFGFLIIISIVRPHIGYGQGRPRFLQHINRLDFFNPTFDGLGVQPIRYDELFADHFTNFQTGYKPNNVFGFTSQYAEYKCQPHDGYSGDMVLRSKNEGLDYFHLLRLFNESSLPQNGEAFTIGNNADFDRIFNYDGDDYDHFISVYHFEVTAYLPMSKLFEDYDFDGGRTVQIDVRGTSMQ